MIHSYLFTMQIGSIVSNECCNVCTITFNRAYSILSSSHTKLKKQGNVQLHIYTIHLTTMGTSKEIGMMMWMINPLAIMKNTEDTQSKTMAAKHLSITTTSVGHAPHIRRPHTHYHADSASRSAELEGIGKSHIRQIAIIMALQTVVKGMLESPSKFIFLPFIVNHWSIFQGIYMLDKRSTRTTRDSSMPYPKLYIAISNSCSVPRMRRTYGGNST